MLLLVDNYDSFTYNLKALFELIGAEVSVIRENKPFYDIERIRGVIISPGPSRPEVMKGAISKLAFFLGKVPILGVCLGMQIIAYFMGHEVSQARTIKHAKREKIRVTRESVILKDVKDGFVAVRYHSLSVKLKNETLSVCAVAESDGEIMAVENIKYNLFGVQFHPESIASEEGFIIARNFMEVCYGKNIKENTFRRRSWL